MERLGAVRASVMAVVFLGSCGDAHYCAERAGSADERVAACTRAIASESKELAKIFSNRGMHWSDKRDHDRAIADYNEAIRLNPLYANAYNNRGNAWRDKREYDRAIADFDDAIRLDPQDAKPYNNRGNAWRDKREYDRAIADYNEAIRLNPQESVAYNNRGEAWRDKREYDRAIADHNEAIRLNPQYADAYNNRGIAWRNKGEYDRAIADYDEAIRLDPQYASAYANRGIAWRNKREYDRAIADYSEAIRLEPNASRFNGIAWTFAVANDEKLRDGKQALDYARRACELTSWTNANYLDTLAAAYAATGDFAQAVQWQEKALNDPQFEKDSGEAARKRLELYRAGKPYRE